MFDRFEILRVYSHRGKTLSWKVWDRRAYTRRYTIHVLQKCGKVGEKENVSTEGCFLLRSTGIVIFQTRQIPPESCPTIAAQSVASILEDLPPFPNPRTDSRLKLGSFFQRDKSHCGFLASVATRSRGNFPVSIVHFFDLLSNVCVDIFNLEKYIYLSPSVSRVAGKGNV